MSGTGLAGSVAQFFLTRGYQAASPSQVGPFIYAAVVYSAAFDWFLWRHHPDLLSFLGASLIILAGVLVLPTERRPGGRAAVPRMKARVVLVRPRNPLNIGAAARAMANFGLNDMVVVRPWAPMWRETVSAVGAEKLVLDARVAGSLEAAVGGLFPVLGTTVVRNRNLERDVVRLPDLADYVREKNAEAAGPVALVFGSEKTGLTNAYLEKCHAYVTVPTDAATPSMNLSHAVAVCCYELSRGDASKGPAPRRQAAASAGEMDLLVKHAARMCDAAGYLAFLSPSRRLTKIRRTLLQWNLRAMDVGLLHGIMRFMENKMKGPDA